MNQKLNGGYENETFLTAAVWLFCIFVFLKQFYLFPSGSVGVGDICLILAGVLTFLGIGKGGGHRILHKEDFFWYLFVLLVIGINSVYFIRTGNPEFIKYTLYWLYCTGAVWVFRWLMDETFLKHVCMVCRINLLLQLIVLFTGHGRLWHASWGAERFMGTFNDPNQFAFFIFTMILFLYLDYTLHPRKTFWLFFAVYLLLLTRAKSTGMLLGTGVFCLANAAVAITLYWKRKKKLWAAGLTFVMIAVILGMGLYLIWPPADFNIAQTDYSLIARIQQKIWMFSKGNLADFLYDRKLERIVLYPRYLLYGAGEGVFERFPIGDFANRISPEVFDGDHAIEIHSSFLSVLFCYGITALILLLIWLIGNCRKMNAWQLTAVLALVVESFTLMNCRQPFFWFIFIFVSAWIHRKRNT
jgi:hypothetical protein